MIEVSHGGESILTITVPLKLKKRGGRKTVILPDGQTMPLMASEVDAVLLKALMRAAYWEGLLRDKKMTMQELAKKEGVTPRYMQKLLQLGFLAPDIKAAILEGRLPPDVKLADVLKGVSLLW